MNLHEDYFIFVLLFITFFSSTSIFTCEGMCRNHFTDKFKYVSLNYIDNTEQDLFELLYEALDCIDGVGTSSSSGGASISTDSTKWESKEGAARGGRVLVHCQQGISRSCAIAIAYIMYKCNIDYDDAHRRVTTAR